MERLGIHRAGIMAPQLTVIKDDVTAVESDLLLLKYARGFHGADEVVALRLVQSGICRESDLACDDGDYRLIDTQGVLGAKRVLFLGTPSLRGFRYRQMRHFARRAIEIVAQHKLPVRTLTTTVHGVNYGLDIEEAIRSLTLGLQQGLALAPLPELEKIVFVERHARRYDVLHHALQDLELVASPPPKPSQPVSVLKREPEPQAKKSVFVAMPFTEEFEDTYQFGIYNTVRRLGYVCEKVDEAVFAGSIIDRIVDGIRGAEFVIADLSLERPNVYLEVGFAWGLNKPVILVAKEGQRLHFDLSHHKCLFYRTIGKLSESLEKTIRDMFPNCPGEPST